MEGVAATEGGVKIVFDVRKSDVDTVARQAAAAGFAVRRYYPSGDEHRPGASPEGYIRLGAERVMREFTDAEIGAIVAAFDAAAAQAGFACERVGIDSWTAGDDAGDREPRTSLPKAGVGFATIGPESQTITD